MEFELFVDDANLFAKGKNTAELYGRVNLELVELDRWF